MVLWVVAAIAALNGYAVVLVWLRSVAFGPPVYRPMLLNIGLSIAPLAILVLALALLLAVVELAPSTVAVWAILLLGGAAWLLLLPNAGYLITELNMSHRRADDPVPLWYDIVAVLSLTMSGVLNTVANVVLVQLIVFLLIDDDTEALYREPWMWAMALTILLLVSFGIYLGRYLRFNSWDLRRPRRFVHRLVEHFGEPGRIGQTALFCALHTVFFTLVYAIVVAPVAAALSS